MFSFAVRGIAPELFGWSEIFLLADKYKNLKEFEKYYLLKSQKCCLILFDLIEFTCYLNKIEWVFNIVDLRFYKSFLYVLW